MTANRPLASIFFGGGTPSLMPPAIAEALIAAAQRHWGFTTDIEITLEANPGSVEAARFADLAAAGVNRVSLGLQSLDNSALRFLERAHDVAEGLAALDTAQDVFGRVSFDLIYALPEQNAADWEAELAQALSFGTGHLSLYQLTIEPGTRFETMVRRGDFIPASPDHAALLFEATQAITNAAGIPAYEISNHARSGQESRHNLTYWRYGDYIGIGPGAHGRRNGLATQRHRKPENWIEAIKRNGHGLKAEDALLPGDRATEALLMGLRLGEGVDLERIGIASGVSQDRLVDQVAIDRMVALGLMKQDGARLVVAPEGMLLLDAILAEIVVAGD